MKTIYKYGITIVDRFPLMLPQGWKFLHLERPHAHGAGAVYMWAEVDTDADLIQYEFAIFGTGHPIPEDEPPYYYNYLGTIVGYPFVWHLYRKDDVKL